MSKLRQWIEFIVDPDLDHPPVVFGRPLPIFPKPWIIHFAMADDGSEHRQVIRAMSEQDAVATFHDNFYHIAYGDDIEHGYDPYADLHYRIIKVVPGGAHRYTRPGCWPTEAMA